MDRRSWPWRKKSSEKNAVQHDSADSSPIHSARHPDDQIVAKVLVGHRPQTSDEGLLQWQQSDERVKHLSERLSATLLDVAAKEELIKQHAKVADEAVSGWEKAEKEAASTKQQLETAIQQKLATEDRVAHLDGALKECMRQLRHSREEQEEKIHEAIVKKTRDWDKVRSELEERLADLEEKYLERDAENKAISKLLQERAVTISEISEAHCQAEARANMLQIQLESMEKENNSLKYNQNVLNKELEIRNEEWALNKKTADAANKRHLDDVKKIAQLEAECQRLRSLVRKKLPGPHALAQMKLEVDAPAKNKIESTGRRSGKVAGLPKVQSKDLGRSMVSEGTSLAAKKDMHALTERLSDMEEEMRRLKELLEKRDNELQYARLMCARTASKISNSEENLDCQGLQKMTGTTPLDMHVQAERISLTNSCEPSLASASDDGKDGEASCAESWASALIAELAHFKKDKAAADVSSLQQLDAVGHLPPLPPKYSPPNVKLENLVDEADNGTPESINPGPMLSSEHGFAKKDANLSVACPQCEQRSAKLTLSETELASLHSQNAVIQSTLLDLQGKLDTIFQAQDEERSLERVLDQVRSSMGITQHANFLEERVSSLYSDTYFNQSLPRPELTSIACKLVQSVEDLSLAITMHQLPVFSQGNDVVNNHAQKMTEVRCRYPELDAKIQTLTASNNQIVDGKPDLLQFMTELSVVISHLANVAFSRNSGLPSTRKPLLLDKASCATKELDEFNGINDPIYDAASSDSLEKEVTKGVPSVERNSPSRMWSLQDVVTLEEELRKVQAEKVAYETHMRLEFARFNGMEQEVIQLRLTKVELEKKLQVLNEELHQLKTHCSEAEQARQDLQADLASAKLMKQFADEQLSSINVSRVELESLLQSNQRDLAQLQERVGTLEKELLEEHEKNVALETKCKDLMEQLLRKPDSTCPTCTAGNNNVKQADKENEIAAAADKLAECQQTILLLGEQIKSLTYSRDPDGDLMVELNDGMYLKSGGEVSSMRYSMSKLGEEEASSSGRARLLHGGHDHTSARRKSRRPRRIKKETAWDPRRDSNASDIMEAELASLSRSGKPLMELFGQKTPLHEHYIQALEEMPSSSDAEDEATADVVSPKRADIPNLNIDEYSTLQVDLEMPTAVAAAVPSSKPPLHKKKNRGAENSSKITEDAVTPTPSSEKQGHSSFTRLFFSRAKSSSS